MTCRASGRVHLRLRPRFQRDKCRRHPLAPMRHSSRVSALLDSLFVCALQGSELQQARSDLASKDAAIDALENEVRQG